MPTETRRLTLSMGSLYGGLASSVVYLVVGQDGTILADTTAAPGTNVAEKTGGAGYDQSNNDRNSRLGQTRGAFAGSPLVTLT